MSPNPVLHAQDNIRKSGVKTLFIWIVFSPEKLDFPQQSAPPKLQANRQVRAKVLRPADSTVKLVTLLPFR
jgi:hypothetical protein